MTIRIEGAAERADHTGNGRGMAVLIILLIIVPASAIWIRRKHLANVRTRRALSGHCLHCGYDLTNNTSDICPECGKWIWID